MKIQTGRLAKFVDDFQLKGDNGNICFDAVILYTTLKKQIRLPSEVHIIHLSQSGLEVIYLLHPDVVKHGLPEKIEDVNSIYYQPNEFLYIKGSSLTDGKYILSIHPTGIDCELSTLKELYQKSYN